MFDLLQMDFVLNALSAIFPLSLMCGIISSLISINRLSYVAGGLTHGAYGGVGIGVFFSLPILLSASVFTLILALLMGYLIQNHKPHSDHFIGAIWAFGMAVGIILIDLSSGYKADMMGYLFGNILLLSHLNLTLLWVGSGVCAFVVFLFYPQLQALSYDEEFALLRGVRTRMFFYLLIVLIAFCITLSMQAVGLILVIALLSIPTFVAQNLCKTLSSMMIVCTLLNLTFCFVGLILSFCFDLSSGASIILVSVLGFALYLLAHTFAKKVKI